MWQRRQFQRHAEGKKFVFDIVAPAPGAYQTFTIAVPESLLVTNLINGRTERLVTYIGGPQRQHVRFFGVQIVALALRQNSQNRLQLLSSFGNAALAFTPVQVRRRVDALVHDGKIGVMNSRKRTKLLLQGE